MEAPQSQKPLVFLSTSAKDAQWRDDLRRMLSLFSERFECWDRSQLLASENWDDQLKDMLERASLAVVLLSRAYIESPETGEHELTILGEHVEKNGLILFPILIEECDWNRYPLNRFRVWSNIPLSKMSSDAVWLENQKIAVAVRARVTATPTPEGKPPKEVLFSTSADHILSAAGTLSLKTNRNNITASCLLFALAGAVDFNAKPPTIRFVRDQLAKKGLYRKEFEAFQKDGGTSEQIVVSISGSTWRVSPTASEIIGRAAEITSNVNRNQTYEVHARHLFAALITPLSGGSHSVRERLKRMGVDESQLCAEFRKFVGSIAPLEIGSEWDAILGTSASQPQIATSGTPQTALPVGELDFRTTYSAFIPDRASYGARAPGELLDDSLNVRTYASHLAQVIAAKDTAMPLSIGLFGAWGAGKSHFIDLLDEQLNELKRQPGNAFHKRIVPIRFNAWHYLDTNLWASLVSEIFDQLFASLESPEEKEQAKLENLKKQLADQSALAAEAKAAVTKAENVRIEAENELRVAVQARIEEEGTVKGLLDDLTDLPIGKEVKKQLNEVAKTLGLPKLKSSFKELETRAEEVASLTGRIKAVWLALFTGPRWWVRAILFAVVLISPLLVSWLALHGTPRIKELLAGTDRTIAQAVAALVTLSAWLTAQIKAGNSIVNKLESAYDEVAKVRADRAANDQDTIKAQAALAQKKQTEEEARHKLHEAEEKLKTIKAEMAELAPGRQLMRFLRERATAEDYRRHLGLVSLVRQDFKQLSDLMTRGSSGDGEATNATNLPVIDRIILYIDDLDRCRAERVIEVLEAVHLLLAFPLFAVVVAVDPRWLRQSLLDHYPRLLGGADSDGVNARARSLGRPATPQDYLEKIFQVPFNLQPMEKTGYESLVDHLFSSNGSKAKDLELPLTVAPSQIHEPLTGTLSVLNPAVNELAQQPPPQTETRTYERKIQPPPEKQPPPPPPPDPERLVLTGKEIADVKKFQLLFQTPRAVKRLANTYSLIRVGVSEGDWSNYLGTGSSGPDYRVPLLLLAVTSAFPALARPWLLWLRATPPTHWQIDDEELAKLIENNADTTASAEWQKLQHCLKAVDLEGWPPPDHESLHQWVPRVARYSF